MFHVISQLTVKPRENICNNLNVLKLGAYKKYSYYSYIVESKMNEVLSTRK